MKRIIISVTNDLVTDQRVHKVATTLMTNGALVTLVGRLLPESLPLNRNYETIRMRLLFRKGALFYAEYNVRLFLLLLFSRADLLVANDLDTLVANFLVSRIRRKALVYDTHEFYTGVPELQDRHFVRKVWEMIEATIFPSLQNIFTVNDSIANIYNQKYHKELLVVRNMPFRSKNKEKMPRQQLGLPEGKKLIILQGAGLNVNRGSEEAIEAMQFVDNAILLILGGGDVLDALKLLAGRLHLGEKIRFLPRMPYNDMMQYTRLADLGLTLDKDTNINYRFSLPNKLFDYIQAEIPVLCTNLVEVAGIVNRYGIGNVIYNLDEQHLAKVMTDMLNDDLQQSLWKENLAKAAGELCWEREEAQLLKIYQHKLKMIHG